MPGDKSNPYESPQSEPSPTQKVVRRMSLIAAVPLVVVSAAAAFCCTCLPIGVVGFSIGYQGEVAPFRPAGTLTMGAAWILGALVGLLAGYAVWTAARRPVKHEAQDPA